MPAGLWEAQTKYPGEVREIRRFLVEPEEDPMSVLVRELEEKIIEPFRCGQMLDRSSLGCLIVINFTVICARITNLTSLTSMYTIR